MRNPQVTAPVDRTRSALPLLLAAVLFAAAPTRAAELPPLAPVPAAFLLSKPGQLALGPTGDRFAVTDRFANRVYVFDSYGKPLWSAGEGMVLAQPTAVLWASGQELVLSQWESRVLVRVAEDSPQRLDTVADLAAAIGEQGRVLRLYPRPDRTYLALTEHPDGLLHLDRDGKLLGVLIEGGSGRGRTGRASACATLSSGRLALAGNSAYPLQIFDALGKLQVVADWNRPSGQNAWAATSVAADARERIWVSDVTYTQFRRYDQGGVLLDTRPFAARTARPVEMAVSADHHLIVMDASGRLEIYDLGGEP
jgi:hypothetical protein